MVEKRKDNGEKTSTEVAETPNHLSNAIAKITGDLERTPEEMQNAIVARILQADSIDDVFAENATLSAEDVIGQPHEVVSVDFSKSRYEAGPPAFAVVTAKFADGETKLYTNGATTALAQLVRAIDHLPIKLVLKQKENPTAQGYYPMYYVKAPQ